MNRSTSIQILVILVVLAAGGVAYAFPKAKEVLAGWLLITEDKKGILATSATPTNFGLQLQLGDGRLVYVSGKFICVQLQNGDDPNQLIQTFGASSIVHGYPDNATYVSPENESYRDRETHRPSGRKCSGADKGVEIGLRVLSEVLNR